MRLAAALALLLLAPAVHAADPSAEAAGSYTLTATASPAELKVGASGKLELTITPRNKAHVHPQAPLKVTLAATPGLRLAKEQLGRADVADAKAEAPRFEVAVTATAAGAQEATAKVDFFICSDAWCVKQIREVKVTVAVK